MQYHLFLLKHFLRQLIFIECELDFIIGNLYFSPRMVLDGYCLKFLSFSLVFFSIHLKPHSSLCLKRSTYSQFACYYYYSLNLYLYLSTRLLNYLLMPAFFMFLALNSAFLSRVKIDCLRRYLCSFILKMPFILCLNRIGLYLFYHLHINVQNILADFILFCSI